MSNVVELLREANERARATAHLRPKRGDKLRDTESGRVGTFAGEVKTSSPPGYCVTWDDDGTAGTINERRLMRCSNEGATDE